jgi:membrane protease YdiL (CAAX protease family)
MQPIPWSDLWPPAADALFVPRLVTGVVAVFVLGSWFGRLAGHPLAAKIVAGIWMAAASAGLVLLLGVSVPETAVLPRSPGLSLVLALGFGSLAVPLIVAATRLPEMQRFYPEIWPSLAPPLAPATGGWSRRRMAVVAAAWLVYLIGYEALFRGLLLPLLVGSLGVWPGIAVTTGLYVLAHLDRPSAESLAAIPTGFIFAVITLVTGSFLAAVLLHWIIATSNELVAVRRATVSRG